ncbi:MAG: DNA gyrase inhibitor YacG [Pseudomonadota bacterium]
MTEAVKGAPCPICNKPAEKAFRPFCSKRCADVDLSRWFSGSYAIPGEPVQTDGDDDDIPYKA